MNITKEEFLKWYPNRIDLWALLTTKPTNEEDLIENYLPSKLWRMNNLYTIITKRGELSVMNMNWSQFVVHSKLNIHPRIIILKSRQQGISTMWLVSFFDDALFIPNLSCGLMAQGREEASKLLERMKVMSAHLNPGIKEFLGISIKKDNNSEYSFSNGSVVFVRTSFRSATLQRLHISEYGKIANEAPKKAVETKTGTLQTLATGNIGVIESTGCGENDFKALWDQARKIEKTGVRASKDFLPVFLSWLDDPSCIELVDQEETEESKEYFNWLKGQGLNATKEQRNFWIMQYRELGENIHQEYPATEEEAFLSGRDGTYYSKKYISNVILRNRRVANLYDPGMPVYACMDLGRNGYTVILFFQVWMNLKKEWELRIIREYYDSGEDLTEYCTILKRMNKEEFNFSIKTVAVPHDANVVDLTARGKSRLEIMHGEGISNTEVLGKEDELSGIELVRNLMPNVWIDKECTYIHSCFLKFTKQWDDLLMVWRKQPKADEYSHGADTIRYMMVYFDSYLKTTKSKRNISDQLSL